MSGAGQLDDRLLSKLMHYCAYRERSVKEAVEKMVSLGIHSNFQELYLKFLLNNSYVDSSRFAHSFVMGKFRINKWGRKKILQGLLLKGVDTELANEAISTINKKEYQATLEELARNKKKGVKAKNKFELNAKVSRYLFAKGYESELIKEIIHRLDKV